MIKGFFLNANSPDQLTLKVKELLHENKQYHLAILHCVLGNGIKRFVRDISGCKQELFGSIRFPDMFAKSREEIKNTALVMFSDIDRKDHRVRFFSTSRKNEFQLGLEIAFSGKATFKNPGFIVVGSGLQINRKKLFEQIHENSNLNTQINGLLNFGEHNFNNAFVFSNYLLSEQGVLCLFTDGDKLKLNNVPDVKILLDEELLKKKVEMVYNRLNLSKLERRSAFLVA